MKADISIVTILGQNYWHGTTNTAEDLTKRFLRGANVLLASLAVSGPAAVAGVAAGAAVMAVQKTADAQQVRIGGISAEEVRLSLPLDVLDEQTEPLRHGPGAGEVYNRHSGRYGNSVVVPGTVTFLVTLDPTEKRLSLVFPRRPGSEVTTDDEYPDVSTTGADLTEFADAVRRLTGRELDGRDLGVRIVLESGIETYQGRPTHYVSAYILAVDAQSGQLISCAGDDGPCLAHMETYFNYGSAGGLSWLRDPPSRELARAGQ